MINSVNFNPNVQNIKKLSFKSARPLELKSDVFVKSNKTKFEEAKELARQKTLEHVNDDGREYGFIFSEDGEVLEEVQGDENKCVFDTEALKKGYMIIHGHPTEVPLSPEDVASLLFSNISSVEAIAPNGRISRMTKTPQTPQYIDEASAINISTKIYRKFLDEFGIDYSVKKEELIEMYKKYLTFNHMSFDDKSDEEILNQMKSIGVYDEDNPEKSYEKLGRMLSFYDMSHSEYNKQHEVIIQNNELIKNTIATPLGVRLINEALTEIADEYNLEYESNME